ncbi:MAG: acyl-CoA dehydratase activase [bacterium]
MRGVLSLGIDVGSVSVKVVLLNEDNEIIEEKYIRHKGQPVRTTADALRELLKRFPMDAIESAGVTGSGGNVIADLLGAKFVNEAIAQTKAIGLLHPEVRTVIDIGGEDSKLLILGRSENDGAPSLEDFSMNTLCAAGTGAFLDQQASRLGISIEEFGELALKSQNPPRIAGRCSVFAKSDMIHLQQKATPDYDIIAGLCHAMARNFKSTIGRGKKFDPPVAFQGGVAANRGMVAAFEEVLDLSKGELIIPKHFASMGAIGAALTAREERGEKRSWRGIDDLERYLKGERYDYKGLPPLSLSESRRTYKKPTFPKEGEKIPAYLGVDVGSLSTNVVVMDENRNILSERYLMTAGRPIEAVKRGLAEVGEEIGDKVEILGACTTGSGRYLIGDFIGADIVKNEITAHARAAVEVDPTVDTIFEIGGQDSKYISLENGAVVDFEMNKACAAGTGSFLEEQAERLNVRVEEEFGRLALEAKCPTSCGERCTVFMESEVVHHQQRGAGKKDIVAGLCYSIVENYLNRVVRDKRIGNNIFFQGGVAFNKGVVAAFEKVTGKRITVPEHHENMGAFGCALIAQENSTGKSNFKGFDLAKKKYAITPFECDGCSNRCQINKVDIEDGRTLYYGGRCERYEMREHNQEAEKIPDLFKERKMLLMNSYSKRLSRDEVKGRIGLPRALTVFNEFYPFWKAFLTELKYDVVLSSNTNREVIHNGVEGVIVETCFPVKVAHGHVLNLLEKNIDFLFIPNIRGLKNSNPKVEVNHACPYVMTISDMLEAALALRDRGVKVLNPVVHFDWGRGHLERELEDTREALGATRRELRSAIDEGFAAQDRFYEAIQRRGKEVLESLEGRAIVIVSRPYNGYDEGVNLDLPKKLRNLGVMSIPMDFLPLDSVDVSEYWPNMSWRYGQKILAAAEIIRENPKLYALYLTNFACGPDSFLINFFGRAMGDKPYLQIEIDEHSADAGVLTRCEAFLDTLENAKKTKSQPRRVPRHPAKGRERTIYFPYMADNAYALKAALEAFGVPAEVMPPTDEESLALGRKYTTGKECYPCIITTGDMVRLLKTPGFDPERAVFLMPTGNGACRFDHYSTLQSAVLNDLGFKIPIYSPNQSSSFYSDFKGLDSRFDRLAWQGIVAVDIFDKLLREIRPYEATPGETDRVYRDCLEELCRAMVRREDLMPVLRRAREAFEGIKVDRSARRPTIGIVGEIFVRSHAFSNDNLIRKVEALGGEVWLPPTISEWLLYVNYYIMHNARRRRDLSTYAQTFIKDKVQKYDEHRFLKVFEGLLRNYHEPTSFQILNYCHPYLNPTMEDESGMSVGKAIDFIKKGLSGIINTIPFTCMPGTITAAILKRLRDEGNEIPIITLQYDGQKDTNTQVRLEAFMHQCKQYMNGRKEGVRVA